MGFVGATTGRRLASWAVAVGAAVAAAVLLVGGTPGSALAQVDTPDCVEHPSPDGHEPPCNPHLAETEWSANHRTSYTQGSSPYPGPVGPPDHMNVHHEGMTAVPIVVSFSPRYPDGGYVVWGSTIGVSGQVFKLDPVTFTMIDEYQPMEEDGPQEASPSGAYNVLDRDNRLIVARQQGLDVYGDDPADRMSEIELIHRFELPEDELCRPDERDEFVGITMTYDGHVVFATRLGIIGVVPRWPDRMTPGEAVTFSMNGERCADGSVDEEELEEIANTLATDEDGGIYVQTSFATWRIDWDGETLTPAWRVEYQDDRVGEGGRLGRGSNSSASVMGTAAHDDRFVVVYDNAEVFNLVLLWRDEIPDGWVPPEGEDQRVACKVPITFGQDDPDETWSEQSVLVRGYGALVVNDRTTASLLTDHTPNRISGYWQLAGGVPGNEPRGMERIDWDPESRTCASRWADPDISIPNTIPTMSVATGLVYAVGVRDGEWSLEALDWESGARAWHVESSHMPTSNSFWAATTVGPDGSIYSGTFGGVTRWQQCDPDEDEVCGKRLDPVTAIVGEEVSLLAEPDGDPADEDPDGEDVADDEEAAPASDGRSLPATGSTLARLGLLAALAAALLIRVSSGTASRGTVAGRGATCSR